MQAELAKIWTNILRYATFALPNLLMMDCEQYDANVFEVIDLINRDYPRGGIALPGLHRRDLPAQGLRLQRGALATRPGMLLAVSRVNESVPLFLVQGLKRRLGSLAGKKIAVLGLAFKADTDDERDSLAHKLIRLLERELADVADPRPARRRRRRSPSRTRCSTPTPSFVATNHPEFCTPDALRAIVSGAKRDALVVDPWDCWGAVAGLRARRRGPRAGLTAGRTAPSAR